MQAARPDRLKQLIVFGAAYLTFGALKRTSAMYWVLAGLLTGLAFLTNQDAVFMVMGLGMAALLAWKDKWAYMGLAVAVFVMLVASYFMIGPVGMANMKLALSNGIKLTWFFNTFRTYLPQIAVILGPAAFLSFKLLASDGESRPVKWLGSLVLIYTFGQLALSLKYGSAPLYFNEPILIGLCLIAYALNDIKVRALAPYALFTLLIANVVWLVESAIGLKIYDAMPSRSYIEQVELTNRIKQDFAQKTVLVLTAKQYEDAITTSLPEQVVMPQRDVWNQIYDALGPASVSQELNYLKSAGPDCLVTDKGTKPSFLDVDLSGQYQEAFSSANYCVWRRK